MNTWNKAASVFSEVGCKAERDAFTKTMKNVFASGRHSKMDARLITLLLAMEWVQLDVLAVIKQLTINRARPTYIWSDDGQLFLATESRPSLPIFLDLFLSFLFIYLSHSGIPLGSRSEAGFPSQC